MAENRIRELLWDRQMKAVDLAEKIGMEAPTLRRYVRRESDPKFDLALKIAECLNATVDEVMGQGSGAELPKWERPRPQGTIPLFGAAQGGAGADITDISSPIEMIPQPVFLSNVSHAYAVYIVGDSMEPRYYAGEIVYVKPGKPPKRGDYVIVQLQNGGSKEAIVKRFVSQSDNRITLAQHNPDKEIQLRSDEVSRVDVIVGSSMQ